ncbi:DUF6170 family protein [Alkalimonas sp. MEB108]|uniref:DUF6170 family protein n=1 Tax=Alkalimonas cellulosilytica TaxID=3058395 RepID=A0ABU7J5I1_9GAMM|nr:DUF6170 family protein [Alkalimonas sp. MEB108]MEE2001545.1 DUF6170 family protein [Alkalimonas sp. MEB108]
MFFNSQRIPELEGLNFAERMQVMRTAADRLPVPKKLLLNLIKLVILFVFFLMMAQANDWRIIPYVIALIVVYPAVTRPLTYLLCRPDLPAIRKELEQEAAKQQ